LSRFEEAITVAAPVRAAYDRWTQFEEFPRFMDGVREVKQIDDKHVRWRADVAGTEKVWEAEIVDQTPDRRIAWKSVEGARNAGAVLFRPLGPEETEIVVRMDVEPQGAVETVGDALGVLQRAVAGDLERFKELVERRGSGEGWRGEIHGDEVRPDPDGPSPTATSIGRSDARR
jgi:uncharacterized membrane protein